MEPPRFELGKELDELLDIVHKREKRRSGGELIKIMNEKKIIRVPVVSKEGKLRGVVSRCDILRAKIEPDFVITYM